MTKKEKRKCPICKLDSQDVVRRFDYGERITINCARCHQFTITRTAVTMAERRGVAPKLSAWVRNRNEQDADIPEINSNSLIEIENDLPEYNPREKQLILLQSLERKSKYPGDHIHLVPEFDIPLAWAISKNEFLYYIKALAERNLISILTTDKNSTNESSITVEITAKGWDYLEEFSHNVEHRSQVFIAMSFSEDMKSVWENSIKGAVEKAGYKPYRIDIEPHLERIDSKIISEIKNSRFVVADVTQQKHGVYFEAGYALGIGIPVIWCVHKNDLKNVHFDTRQYNHLVWDNEEELKDQLYNFICAVIGKA